MKPNLFVIGAAKSGTSSLHEYLDVHPDVVMSTEKEPQFFLAEEHHEPYLRPAEGSGDSVESMYLRLFPDIESKRYAGESSPEYTAFPHHGDVAWRIRDFNSDARLIYIVRDPIERTLSHYWYWCAIGSETCTSPGIAIHETSRFRNVSNYALQLSEYLRYFPKQQIYVCTLEQLMTEPAATMGAIFHWLGLALPANHSDDLYSVRKNITPTVFSQRRALLPWRLRKSRLFARVRSAIPQAVRRNAWALMTSERLNSRKVDRSKVDLTELTERLREVQIPEVREFEKLCGRDFPEWKTLWKTTNHGRKSQHVS